MSRVMELAIAIKGRLDGSVGSTMSQAVAHAKQMKDQLRVANREMASLQKQAAKQQSSKGYVEYDTELAMLQAQVKKIALAKKYEAITDRINAKQKASANWSQAVSNLSGTAMKTAVLAAPLVGATKAAMAFESEMAEIRKVVDFDTP